MGEHSTGKSVDIGKMAAQWLIRNWKTVGIIFTIIGSAAGAGYVASDLGHKHNEAIKRIDALEGNAEEMGKELRGLRESSIRQEVILERIERKLP